MAVTHLKKILHVVLGILLVLLGFAGLILPVLNGVVPLLIGLILLSFESPYLEKKLYEITKKNSTLHNLYNKLVVFVKRLFSVDV